MFLINLRILIKSRLPNCNPLLAKLGSSSALTNFGTKALVDFGSTRFVTYGVFFGMINNFL